jgi:regulator of protease activity HflC (stomatin/prohibitin superfamily)
METKKLQLEEKRPRALPGMPMMILFILLYLAGIAAVVYGGIMMDDNAASVTGIIIFVAGMVYLFLGWIPFMGLKILKPQEAMVLTLFGRYIGTLREAGFYYVNPFVSSVAPPDVDVSSGVIVAKPTAMKVSQYPVNRKISLKAITLNNAAQKINDLLGNPVEIGIVVIWRVVNTVKAVFNVDNYKEYLSIQADAALRNIVRMYPYDVSSEGDEKSLRGSSREVSDRIRDELQQKVEIAGIEIVETRITYLAYAPEIAAAMLQRQQATAIIDARKMIVDGAVGMVEMALAKLSENNIVVLDDERKAAMVSNLLVVLCGNRDAQPVVNSGSIY